MQKLVDLNDLDTNKIQTVNLVTGSITVTPRLTRATWDIFPPVVTTIVAYPGRVFWLMCSITTISIITRGRAETAPSVRAVPPLTCTCAEEALQTPSKVSHTNPPSHSPCDSFYVLYIQFTFSLFLPVDSLSKHLKISTKMFISVNFTRHQVEARHQ